MDSIPKGANAMSDYQTQIHTVYDNTAERARKAWLTFLELYVLEHPQPPAPKWWNQFPVTMVIFGVVATAGMLLSALRTAPTFQSIAAVTVGAELASVEALLAIIVVELFLVTVRFVIVVQKSSTEIVKQTMRWMMTGFVVALTVALAANLYSTTKDLLFIAPFRPVIDFIASIIIGGAAPLLAVISGDIMGLLWLKSEAHRASLRQQYDVQMQMWTSARDERWKSDKARFGGTIRIQTEPVPAIASHAERPVPSVPSHVSSHETGRDVTERHTGYGFQRTADGETQVLNYFNEHPDEVALPVRELEARIGVSKSTVSRARRKWQEQNGAQS